MAHGTVLYAVFSVRSQIRIRITAGIAGLNFMSFESDVVLEQQILTTLHRRGAGPPVLPTARNLKSYTTACAPDS